VEARFSRLEALREKASPLQDLTIRVNGEPLVFQARLDTDWYLEYAGQGSARVFDANGFTQARVLPQGTNPVLRKGSNQIDFLCGGGGSARVTLIVYGQPLR
jgi:hypothetical protein